MNLSEFIEYCRAGNPIRAEDKALFPLLLRCSQEALKTTRKINSGDHSPEQIADLFRELTGLPVGENFMCFPPFHTDFGKNIHIGDNVFFNTGCSFQDRGGIFIGDGCMIGMNVNIATLNHGLDVATRGTTFAAPVRLGNNVWVGSNATILAGVTVGDNAVIAAGAVVTKDVPANTVVGGVPARIIKSIS